MITFTLATPVNVGTITAPVIVASLQVTGVSLSTTPALAPLGAAELKIVLTDPTSGWQESVTYLDASVLAFFAQAAPTPTAGESMQDVMATAIFNKLIADKKLPAGSITTSTSGSGSSGS